jgi:uncharacterized oxidoreductase
MITIQASRLIQLGIDIFMAQGLGEVDAGFLVNSLVEANLAGHDSHGAHYYARYSERISEGFIRLDVEPKIIKETPGTAYIDGQWGLGQLTARRMTEIAVEKAKVNMVAAVGSFNTNHIGRIGYYTEMAARQGIITTLYVNVGHPIVSAHNGHGPLFGTNPYSASVPVGGDIPFLVDYATSVVAAGKLSVARAAKKKIPTHWTLDKDGNTNDSPTVLSEGGWMLPFGLYKGMGLQMVSELLGAVLTGSRVGPSGITSPPSPNGVFMLAVNPEAFVGLDEFVRNTDSLLRQVKGWRPLEGKRVMVPGEPEKETKLERLANGIGLPDDTWSEIVALCEGLGIPTAGLLG